MKDKIILDTNIWIYLYSKNPLDKSNKARKILNDKLESIIISTQILGEFYHVLTRKKMLSITGAKDIIIQLTNNFSIVEIDTIKVLQALDINSKYQYSYWDSLIIATALNQNCSIIYSEDMQSNHLIENKTTIINPFI